MKKISVTVIQIVVILVVMVLLSALLLTGWTELVYRLKCSAQVLVVGIDMIYVLDGIVGGLLARRANTKQPLGLGLICGILFWVLLFVLSVAIIPQEQQGVIGRMISFVLIVTPIFAIETIGKR